MTDFTRLYILSDSKGAENAYWGSGKGTSGIIISLKEDKLKVFVKFGCSPMSWEVNSLFGLFFNEYMSINSTVDVFKRTRPYRFVYKTGVSGCQDTFLEVDNGDGFPSRKKITHMSMCGKMNQEISCYVYDFLDLAVSGGLFTVFQEVYYFYNEKNDSAAVDVASRVQVIKPRETAKETGWVQPGQYGEIKYIYEKGVVVREGEGEAEIVE